MTFVRNSLIRDLFSLKRINHVLYRQKRSFSITLRCRNHQYNTPIDDIRNFCIIAHIDHGKSTLADRLLEVTGAISKTVDNQQILDNLQVERERGITVKAQTVSIYYEFKKNGKVYLLNLIDTPGHVDFSSEVTRSLSICDGCVLLVDATNGVQAQTVANFHLAKSNGLIIIPVINKIDMKHANPDKVAQELGVLFGIDASEILKISAKLGHGVEDVLEAIIARIPSPANINRDGRFRALVFDSWYDRYRGALNLVYVHDGQLNMGQEIQSIATKKIYPVRSISLIRPDEFAIDSIKAGQIGLIGCNMRNSKESIIGDTLRIKNDNEIIPLDIIKQRHQPIVFAGIYPTDQSKYVNLQSAIDKLSLNDSSVSIANDSSPALSYGWRIGFLGLLHMEVFCQRLEQEYDADLIITAPSVTYNITLINQKLIKLNGGRNSLTISNPAAFPNATDIGECFEPCIIGTIITPVDYMGQIISLCIERRGVQRKSMNLDNDRILMEYVLPLNEIIVDFNDKLKSLSSGYASFNYEDHGYHSTNIAKLDILLNGKKIDELCRIVHVSKATSIARDMVFKLKEEIPRQMVQIAIQACVGSKILARETIKAFRKDVTAKLYGGDVTRRMKLLRQQAEGKKKMRSIANIRIPHETFINVLKR